MNKQTKKSFYILSYMMWALSAVFYFYEFLLQVSPSVMINELMHDFSINATAFGYLTASYYWAYGIMQLPVGVLIDRFGSRRLLTLAALICAVGCFLFSIASSFYLATLGRTLIGLGSAFAVVGCLSLASHWFPPKRFALLTGLMLTIGMTGAACGAAPIALILKYFSWRTAILYFGAGGTVLSLLFWFILRDQPKHVQPSEKNRNDSVKLLSGLSHVIRHKETWLVSIYGGLMFAPTSIFSSVWGTQFLSTSTQLAKPVAALLTSCIFLGWAVSSPCIGWLSDAIGRRKPLMLTGAVGAFLCVSCIIYIPHLPKWALAILLFGFGAFSSALFLAFAIAREINPKQYSGTVLGFMNMMNTVGIMFGPPLIGFILDSFWSDLMKNGIPVYTLHSYQIALTALPVMIFIAILTLPFIRETRCIPMDYELYEKDE